MPKRLNVFQPTPLLTLIAILLSIMVYHPQSAYGAQTQRLLVLGDSLSAAYNMRLEQGWVNLLSQKLNESSQTYHVINASISGETSAGGLARLPKLLELHQPQLVIIELGGNDGLRGYPLQSLRANLTKMVQLSRQAGAKVLLLGMQIPPNYGKRYTQGFQKVYTDIAKQMDVPSVPFFLEDVALKQELMLPDGIHPNAKAQPLLASTVLQYLDDLL